MASVPVVGYLSFLASSSPIASDFIALADHLKPTPKNYKKNRSSIINNLDTHFGILSEEEPFSGCLQQKFNKKL